MMKPFLRIVVIARDNTSGMLKKTLDSLMAQSYENCAIDVLDCNDHDSAASLCLQEDIVAYPGVTFRQLSGTRPMGALRNEAFAQSECDYICFAAVDEVWAREKAALQIYQMEDEPHAGASCCGGSVVRVGAHHSEVLPGLSDTAYKETDWLLHPPVQTSGQVLYRARALESIGGFNERMNGLCDLDALFRIRDDARILFFPVPLITGSVLASRRYFKERFSDTGQLLLDARYTDCFLVDRSAFLAFNLERARLARKACLPLDNAQTLIMALMRTPVRFLGIMFVFSARQMSRAVSRIAHFLLYRRRRGVLLSQVRAGRLEHLAGGRNTHGAAKHAQKALPVEYGAIPAYALMGDLSLTSVTIPDHVETVGRGAFAGCTQLRSVIFPDSVRSIECGAFLGCLALRDVRFGKQSNLQEIGNEAFAGCGMLNTLLLPGMLRKIGRYCFAGNVSLESVSFYQDSLAISKHEEDSFAHGMREIPDGAFMHCHRLKHMRFDTGCLLERIGVRAFDQCRSLREVWLDAQIVSIGANAFRDCHDLINFVIVNNSTLRAIGVGAFHNCWMLRQFVFSASMTRVEKDVFNACRTLKSIRLPEGVHTVSSGAFLGCDALSEVFIENPYAYVHRNAFASDVSLTRIAPKKDAE